MRLNSLRNLALAPDGAGGGGDAAAAFAAAAQTAGAKAPTEKAPPAEAATTDLDVDFVGLDAEGDAPPPAGKAPAELPPIGEKPPARVTLPDFKTPPKKPFEPVKPATEPKPASDAPPPAEPPPVAAAAAAPFDDPQDAVFLNKMHKEAAAHFSKRIKSLAEKANKTLSVQDSFYTHPEGFTLLPEYREISTAYAGLKAEQDHWQAALTAIEQNQPFRLFEGLDEQGQPILSEIAYKPTVDAKVKIQTALMGLTSELGAKRAQAAELRTKFGSTYESAVKTVNDERIRRFPWVRDPKLADQEVEIEGYGKAPIKKVKEDFLALIPPIWRGLPVSEAMADTFIALRIALNKLKEQGTQAREAQLVEPVVPGSAGAVKAAAEEDAIFDAEGMPG